MLIYLAGLQGISPELYEAARLDGANRWQQFRSVTVPLVGPSTFFLLIMNVIYSFQVFDLIFVMTGGGPGNATSVLVTYAYDNGFVTRDQGYAAAIGIVLLLSRSPSPPSSGDDRPATGVDRWSHDFESPTRHPGARRGAAAGPARRGLVARTSSRSSSADLLFPLYWMLVVAFSPRGELLGAELRLWPRAAHPRELRPGLRGVPGRDLVRQLGGHRPFVTALITVASTCSPATPSRSCGSAAATCCSCCCSRR